MTPVGGSKSTTCSTRRLPSSRDERKRSWQPSARATRGCVPGRAAPGQRRAGRTGRFLVPPAQTDQDAQVLAPAPGSTSTAPTAETRSSWSIDSGHEVKCPSCDTVFHLEPAAVIPGARGNGEKKSTVSSCSRTLARAGSARSTVPMTRSSTAPSRSRCCGRATSLQRRTCAIHGRRPQRRELRHGSIVPFMRSARTRAFRSSSETSFAALPWPTRSGSAGQLMTWRPAWWPSLPSAPLRPRERRYPP